MKKANEFIDKYFKYSGFEITDIEERESDSAHIIFAEKFGKKYKIYTYHFVGERTLDLTDDLIVDMLVETPRDTICLMVYFEAVPIDSERYEYRACNSSGMFEVWRIEQVKGTPTVIFYPRKTFWDLIFELYKVTTNKKEEDLEFLVKGKIDEDGRELYKSRIISTIKSKMINGNPRIDIGFYKTNDLVYSLVLVINGKEYIVVESAERNDSLDDEIDYIKNIYYHKIEKEDEIIIDNDFFQNIR